MSVKDLTLEDNPCDGCEVGWGSISQWRENDHLMQESSSCHETCEILKGYVRGERMFGNNIRSTIRALKG